MSYNLTNTPDLNALVSEQLYLHTLPVFTGSLAEYQDLVPELSLEQMPTGGRTNRVLLKVDHKPSRDYVAVTGTPDLHSLTLLDETTRVPFLDSGLVAIVGAEKQTLKIGGRNETRFYGIPVRKKNEA